MFRKVPFIWASHFPKLLCHWLERSHFSDAIGKCAPTFCTVSSWQSTCSSSWEPGTSTRSLGLFHLQYFKQDTCNTQVENPVPLWGPLVCQIIKTTNNIFPLFDDDKQWYDLRSSPELFPLTVYSPLLYIPPYLGTNRLLTPYLDTNSLLPPFGIIKKRCSKPVMST